MSHCVNYILREGFDFKTTSRRYGAKEVTGLVLRGPGPTILRLRQLLAEDADEEEPEALVADGLCEATLLVDRDSRLLRVFGGELLPATWAFRDHYVRLLKVAWPGWDADWAEGGTYGLLGGLPFAEPLFWAETDAFPADAATELLPWSPGPPDFLGHRATIITYRDPEGRWSDALTSTSFECLLAAGPGCFSLPFPPQIRALDEALLTAEGGFILFPGERKVFWWQAAPDLSWHWHARSRLWSNINFERTSLGGLAHLRLTDRDETALTAQLPGLRGDMLDDCWCAPGDMAKGVRTLLARDEAQGSSRRTPLLSDGPTEPLSSGLMRLQGLGVFPVVFSGAAVRSPLAQCEALYFERTNVLTSGQIVESGDPHAPPYMLYSGGGSLGHPVQLHTELGVFDSSPHGISMHLQPSLVEDFGAVRAAQEADWVSGLRDEADRMFGASADTSEAESAAPCVLLLEHRITAGRTYWAEVESREECLPPETDGAGPRDTSYLRLRVCDRPFLPGEDLGWPTLATQTQP